MMHLFILLVSIVLSFSAYAEYTWYNYDAVKKQITFGTRYSDHCNDKRTFYCDGYPTFVTIDRECDIAYVLDPKSVGMNSKTFVFELNQPNTNSLRVINEFNVTLHPFSVKGREKHYPRARSRSSIDTAIQSAEAWKLYTEFFCFEKGVDLMAMVSVQSDSDLILKHALESLDVETMKDLFFTNSPDSRNYCFKTALAATNPYAYALMYLALKHGLWGTNASEELASIYKDGADKKTIASAELNLETIRKGLDADPLGKQY